MTLQKILDFALPLPKGARKCKYKMQQWEHKRNKLAEMIEQYKNGEVVNFQPLHLSIDLDELMKKIQTDN